MTTKHYMLIAGCLVGIGAMMSGFHDWAEMAKPSVLGGVLGIIGTQLASLFSDRPQ